jgi:CHAT domain-containing protein
MKTLLAALVSSLCALTVLAESADDAARRYLRDTYEGRFASARPGTAQFERRLRFAQRVRCFSIEGLAIRDVAVDGDSAVARVDVTFRKTDRLTPGEWTAPETTPLRLKLVREEDRWLVANVELPDAELAEQLIAGSIDDARRLLREHPERATKGLARALYDRALALLNAAKMEAGARAGVLSREVAIAAGDRGGEALAIGIAIFTAPDHEDPLRWGAEAVEIAKETNDPDILGRAWYNLGRAYGAYSWEARRRGRMHAERAECYRKAAMYAERAEDPLLLIRVLYSKANVAANESDHVVARRDIDRSIALAREFGDTGGIMTGETVLATIYLEQGDRERGLFHHNRALELAGRNESYAYWTLLLRSGVELVIDERYDEARAVFAKVFYRDERGNLKTKGPVPGNHIGTAVTALAHMEAAVGHFDEAECLLREAAVRSNGSADAYVYTLAPAHNRRGDFSRALQLSLSSLTDSGLYTAEKAAALLYAARAYRGLGQRDRAAAAILEAIEMRESIDARVAGDVTQRALASDQTAEYYEVAAELAIDRGDPGEALAFLERGRARVLTAIVENGRPGAMEDADAAAQDEKERQEKALAQLSRELDRARAAHADTSELSARLDRARATHASFLDGLAARSERRAAARHHAGPENLPEGLVAVSYLVTETQLHAFIARRGAPVIHRAKKIERKVVEERVDRFLESLEGRDLRFDAAARSLHQLLIAPLDDATAGAGALLIVPDGVLWRVPFAALLDARGRFLVERAAIVYAPSITACAIVAESGKDRPARPTTLFAVGNPTLDPTAKNALTSLYRDATLGPLPDAEREVDTVRTLYGARTLVLKGTQATEERTRSAIGDARIVHFATHALLDDTHPMYSRLALARDDRATDDGWLESWEIARLDLAADIVVLSACETARGRIGGGEGVVGMAWSFFVAGARSTLATQWKVGSSSTAELMIAFHRALRAGRNPSMLKAEALRAAQLEMLADERYRHPYYWAAFVLLGDPSAQREN